ncbi:MAG: SUF system NifU family Fe-S cluster assembly protein [Candidatus Marinimicrobia bacterium]|jgi:nitrogen fixation NifU-like protein|nr:SUF system NifU family Fe-S cluster assembly protein [Candidatus Neomarinimicrobiota bacterium]MDP7026061.1 SUF system NifU family Fe-S cluster assembly protein [Candidatus Neomarinimicrobiota bacterium]|tara:strand:- start:2687 stop:3130 length:444 start_codon:yes stop_codon:yes gene_type:complete
MDDLRELYQELILDHNQNPHNYGEMDDPTATADGFNPLCGDRLTLYLRMSDEVVEDIKFVGSGCAISKASASIMTTLLKGKTRKEAITLFEMFHKMVTTGELPEGDLGKLAVLSGVYKYPARVKCAVLAWHTSKNALEGKESVAKTE